jgi:hypothetical protein
MRPLPRNRSPLRKPRDIQPAARVPPVQPHPCGNLSMIHGMSSMGYFLRIRRHIAAQRPGLLRVHLRRGRHDPRHAHLRRSRLRTLRPFAPGPSLPCPVAHGIEGATGARGAHGLLSLRRLRCLHAAACQSGNPGHAHRGHAHPGLAQRGTTRDQSVEGAQTALDACGEFLEAESTCWLRTGRRVIVPLMCFSHAMRGGTLMNGCARASLWRLNRAHYQREAC